MTNGQVTKRILAACKSLYNFPTKSKKEVAATACSILNGHHLHQTVTALLRSFPLSSFKLVYESDRSKMSPEAWAILLAACVSTDKAKLEAQHRMMRELDASYDTNPGLFPRSFGRFVGEDED